jgi:tetratricopeptide (TPR) repeat protein
MVHQELGDMYFMQRDYDKSLEQCRKSVEISPTNAGIHFEFFDVYVAKSMGNQAIEELELGLELEGRSQRADEVRQSNRTGGYEASLRKFNEISRNPGPDDYDPLYVADTYLLLGDKGKALAWLDKVKARETRSSFIFLKVDPRWDTIRSDARFRDLLRSMNLPRE